MEGQTMEKCGSTRRRVRDIARRRLTRRIRSTRRGLVMKRRPKCVEASRRSPSQAIQRRVETLKHLIPTAKSSQGLDGVFRETADYILALQMKVRVMQTLVQVLTHPNPL